MKAQYVKGATSVILTVFIQNSSSTTGAGLGSLDQTSSIVGGYVRAGGTGVALAVDENVTTEGTYEAPSTAAQVRIGTPANMTTGTYELHFHNDLFASGADIVTITLGGASNMAPLVIEVQLTDLDLNTATVNPGADGITAATIADNAITVDQVADGTLTEAKFATDTKRYFADLAFRSTKDGTPTDSYTVMFYEDGEKVDPTGTPTLQVVKRSDGTDLIAASNMTQISTTGIWKLDETTSLQVSTDDYYCVVVATIGSSQTMYAYARPLPKWGTLFEDGFLAASKIADDAIDDATFADDTNNYIALINVAVDGATGPTDRYGVSWYKNGVYVGAGITAPAITVVALGGAVLISAETMTEEGDILGTHYYEASGVELMTPGQIYAVKCTATIDGSTRTMVTQHVRDSSA